jgi:hypothetical protein
MLCALYTPRGRIDASTPTTLRRPTHADPPNVGLPSKAEGPASEVYAINDDLRLLLVAKAFTKLQVLLRR